MSELIAALGAPPPRLRVHASLGWDPVSTVDSARAAADAGQDLLSVRIDGGLGLVGPLLAPGARGCAWCAEAWRRRLLGDDYPADLTVVVPAPAAVPPALLDVVVALAHDPASVARLRGGVYVVRGADLAGRLHHFSPYPRCPRCGVRTAAGAATGTLRARPQAEPDDFRAGNGVTATQMRAAFVDWRYGPVAHVSRDEQSPMCLVTTEMLRPVGNRLGGYGRDLTYPDSERVALFEAFERAATSAPAGRHTVVTGSFRDLSADAVDPVALGLPDEDPPPGRFVPYRDDVATAWVWGWSFGQQRPVLVPEHVAYWDAPARPGTARFIYESSNGCALGASLEEATLYGLLEVIERDSFLLAWHARLALPALVPDAADTALGHLTDRLEADGYTLRLYDMRLDHPVASVLSLAVAEDPDRAPQAFFAAGAHPDPGRAIRSAAAEVATNALLFPRRRDARPEVYEPARLRPMLRDPGLVRTLDDHIALHTLPEARDRYAHLLHDRPPRTVEQAYGDWRARWHRSDLTQVLTGLLADFAERGLDVVVVDVTDPDHRDRLGLHAVKVLVPGTLPMTFGHAYRRLGAPRLRTVPVALGYPDDPHTVHPHPFP